MPIQSLLHGLNGRSIFRWYTSGASKAQGNHVRQRRPCTEIPRTLVIDKTCQGKVQHPEGKVQEEQSPNSCPSRPDKTWKNQDLHKHSTHEYQEIENNPSLFQERRLVEGRTEFFSDTLPGFCSLKNCFCGRKRNAVRHSLTLLTLTYIDAQPNRISFP
jgi:hypothetical protein